MQIHTLGIAIDDCPRGLPDIDADFLNGIVPIAEPIPIADHTNLRKPFDRCHGIPSRNDGTQWVAMYDQERLAVHGVGKQRPRPMGGVVQAQTSLKANWFTTHIKFAAVGTAELLLSHPL